MNTRVISTPGGNRPPDSREPLKSRLSGIMMYPAENQSDAQAQTAMLNWGR